MPNPTLDKVLEGREIARNHKADLLLAVGGGSVIDYAKAVSVSVHTEGDPWEKFFAGREKPSDNVVPVGCVLTMVGTGSEMTVVPLLPIRLKSARSAETLANRCARGLPS